MEAKKLKNLVIELVHGDITECDDDVIVNAANNALWMGAGVAGAIKAKGGIEIEKEAMAKGPVAPGSAVETGAGKLKAHHIIHAAVMGQDLETNENLIRLAVRNSLTLADRLGMDSIVFPALGTGVGRFPVNKCAAIMFDEVIKFDKTGPGHLKKVKFALYSKRAYDDFEIIYRNII